MILQATAHTYLDGLKASVDQRMKSTLDEISVDELRSVVLEAVDGGKRVRPLITMLACGAVGGNENDALDAGTAVEMMHTASLVHDDIMDRSELRRGRPTIHTRYDIPTAILVGDTLIAMAFRMLHQLTTPRKDRILRMFSNGSVHLCEGQSEDLWLGRRKEADARAHKRMVERKTASLIEVAAAAGALIGSSEEFPVLCLRCFGLNVGLAFQAMDDLLDAVGDESIVGKSLGIDRLNGKKTFLTAGVVSPDSVEQITNLVTDYTRVACNAVRSLSPTPARECLVGLAQSLVDRKA